MLHIWVLRCLFPLCSASLPNSSTFVPSVHMSLSHKCCGTYTWSFGNSRSTALSFGEQCFVHAWTSFFVQCFSHSGHLSKFYSFLAVFCWNSWLLPCFIHLYTLCSWCHLCREPTPRESRNSTDFPLYVEISPIVDGLTPRSHLCSSSFLKFVWIRSWIARTDISSTTHTSNTRLQMAFRESLKEGLAFLSSRDCECLNSVFSIDKKKNNYFFVTVVCILDQPTLNE